MLGLVRNYRDHDFVVGLDRGFSFNVHDAKTGEQCHAKNRMAYEDVVNASTHVVTECSLSDTESWLGLPFETPNIVSIRLPMRARFLFCCLLHLHPSL